MVIQIGALKSGRDADVEADIRGRRRGRPRGRRDRQGHLRERLPDRRREGPRLPPDRGGRRRLRQDLDRLRAERRDPRRPAPDAREHVAAHPGQGGRRRPDARRAARGDGPRRDADRGDGDDDDHRRLPGAQGRRRDGRGATAAAAAGGSPRAATDGPRRLGRDRDARLRVHRRVPRRRPALRPERPRRRELGRGHGAPRGVRPAVRQPPARDSIDAVCADPEVDLVVVSLPNQLHLEAVRSATAPRQGRRLHEAARPERRRRPPRCSASSATRASSTPTSRTSSTAPRWSGCARWSRPGAIGRPTTFRAREGHSGPHAAHFWDAELAGGGALLDMASHGTEAARYLFGKDAVAAGRLRLGRHARPHREDHRRGQRDHDHPVRGRAGRDDGRLVVVEGRARGPLRGLRRRRPDHPGHDLDADEGVHRAAGGLSRREGRRGHGLGLPDPERDLRPRPRRDDGRRRRGVPGRPRAARDVPRRLHRERDPRGRLPLDAERPLGAGPNGRRAPGAPASRAAAPTAG